MGHTTQDPHIQKEHIKLRENLKFGTKLSKIQLFKKLENLLRDILLLWIAR